MFVLDASGSVGPTNYQRVRDYTFNYTESLLRGNQDSRVGVIVYSSSASVEIELDFLDNNNTQEALLEEIRNLPYFTGGTNTPEGLCLLMFRPWRESVSVLRIAIVLTDGMSNVRSTSCRSESGAQGTVSSTAQEIHTFEPPITVFAVGVANFVEQELNTIATSPDLVDMLDSFDQGLLLQNQQFRSYFICFRGIIKHKNILITISSPFSPYK